jgi:hypothetical protein
VEVKFCPGEKCKHYSQATKYPRKCYYEPQCWRGYLDILMVILKFRLKKGCWRNWGRYEQENAQAAKNIQDIRE